MVLSLFLALDLYNMYQISSFVQGKRSILGLTFVMVIRVSVISACFAKENVVKLENGN